MRTHLRSQIPCEQGNQQGIQLAFERSARSTLPPQFGGGIENGADDLVVAGAPAKVAGEPVARLGFRRIRIAVQQGLGRDQHARRTESALERRMLEKFPLQWMEIRSEEHTSELQSHS